MFDAISYNKGGLILHSLRKTLGDSVFFKGLNLYLNRHAYKTVEIHDLRLALEEVSGTDLNWFFNQWFLSPGHPVPGSSARGRKMFPTSFLRGSAGSGLPHCECGDCPDRFPLRDAPGTWVC